jgi:hypothetical protein
MKSIKSNNAKTTTTPQAMRVAPGHWFITAYSMTDQQQYHYLAIEDTDADESERFGVFEVYPVETNEDVGDFASLDEAMDEIAECLEEGMLEPEAVAS